MREKEESGRMKASVNGCDYRVFRLDQKSIVLSSQHGKDFECSLRSRARLNDV